MTTALFTITTACWATLALRLAIQLRRERRMMRAAIGCMANAYCCDLPGCIEPIAARYCTEEHMRLHDTIDSPSHTA